MTGLAGIRRRPEAEDRRSTEIAGEAAWPAIQAADVDEGQVGARRGEREHLGCIPGIDQRRAEVDIDDL
jgi:hypothetical protein